MKKEIKSLKIRLSSFNMRLGATIQVNILIFGAIWYLVTNLKFEEQQFIMEMKSAGRSWRPI
ncbi:MAG: hypothetical protein IPH94_21625 [Saprospiraceae bacterium]|nr:hypothetical protein [Saprospiraceae bacterium]